MHARLRALVAGAIAAAALAALVGNASANRFSVNEQRWRHVWTPITFSAIEFTVRCNLTVEGSFHSSVSLKVRGALSGFATRAILATPCTGGNATILSETLPWHISYTSFEGVLPRITAIRQAMIGAGFRIEVAALGITCLARLTEEFPGRSITTLEAGGAATSIRADETAIIKLTGFICPEHGAFSGTGVITKLGTTERIVVRLI